MHAVLERQLAALSSGDLEAVMENYAPDATLLRFDQLFVGVEAIRLGLSIYLAHKPRLVTLEQYAEHGDTLLYRAVMNVGGQDRPAVGTLVLRNGRIWRQTVAFIEEEALEHSAERTRP
ncbi:nuclear transport factor 2 family protein [Streptomyces sp. RLB1-33]|nr:nuclear transport factor 2 family protein [Streptomyces sp. RLB1-33]QIY76011.1 nuclear transport factor 2 family protein [Streptomyces sp. RLB1-33]